MWESGGLNLPNRVPVGRSEGTPGVSKAPDPSEPLPPNPESHVLLVLRRTTR